MGILDSIVEWIATQVMNLLDMITGSVLGALGCDMSTFLRYFPAAETLYDVFVAIAIGFILLNLVWQLFKNFGVGIGLSAEDPAKLAIRSVVFIFLAYFSDDIIAIILGIAGTPYSWVVDASLPSLDFASFGSVLTVIVGCVASGSVSLIVLILLLVLAGTISSSCSRQQSGTSWWVCWHIRPPSPLQPAHLRTPPTSSRHGAGCWAASCSFSL